MNSHFKKNKKRNTGKIGVWDIKERKEKRNLRMNLRGTVGNKTWLTSVKDMLRKTKRRSFYPLISSLGVKMSVNTVNITKLPPNFQSRRETTSIMGSIRIGFVNNKKLLRRGLGSQC